MWITSVRNAAHTRRQWLTTNNAKYPLTADIFYKRKEQWKAMKKITSFCVDHDVLEKGMYISRIDGDVITYDLRMVKPNKGGYLENAGLHTFEHLFATYVRNSAYSDDIIYVGPMGCRTGFYLLTRDHLSHEQALSLVQETMDFIAAYEGEIPGAQESRECGNYLDHDLAQAKQYAGDYGNVLKEWTTAKLHYED